MLLKRFPRISTIRSRYFCGKMTTLELTPEFCSRLHSETMRHIQNSRIQNTFECKESFLNSYNDTIKKIYNEGNPFYHNPANFLEPEECVELYKKMKSIENSNTFIKYGNSPSTVYIKFVQEIRAERDRSAYIKLIQEIRAECNLLAKRNRNILMFLLVSVVIYATCAEIGYGGGVYMDD